MPAFSPLAIGQLFSKLTFTVYPYHWTLGIATFTVLISFSAFSQSIDSKSWMEDIDFYKTSLEENHIDLYNKISKAEFEQELEQIKASLKKK